MKTITLQINKPILNYKPGQEIQILTDKKEIPLDEYWRRRLKDAETDNCCEIVKKTRKEDRKK